MDEMHEKAQLLKSTNCKQSPGKEMVMMELL